MPLFLLRFAHTPPLLGHTDEDVSICSTCSTFCADDDFLRLLCRRVRDLLRRTKQVSGFQIVTGGNQSLGGRNEGFPTAKAEFFHETKEISFIHNKGLVGFVFAISIL